MLLSAYCANLYYSLVLNAYCLVAVREFLILTVSVINALFRQTKEALGFTFTQ